MRVRPVLIEKLMKIVWKLNLRGELHFIRSYIMDTMRITAKNRIFKHNNFIKLRK